MANALIIGCFFIFSWRVCDGAYFDDQPKLLTENGNFVIESAVDRNVSFRLKGSSYLNINDVNIMHLVGSTNQSSSSSAAVTGTSNSNLAIRLSTLEGQFRQFQTPGRPNRQVLRRLTALEQRIGGGSNSTWTNVNRRIRQLEVKMQRILTRLNTNNCTSNGGLSPCQNGGTCTNTFGGYMCHCLDTWTGSNCEEDVNECTIFANTDLGCQNSISCENTPGGYTCRCKPGWLGIHCTKRTADCSDSSAYEMCGHGVCVHTNDPTTYRCICDQGWTSNGSSPACTVDVNECDSAIPHCSKDPEVPCINLPGTYACGQCPNGFTGNGHYCRDVDECETNNGGCSLSPFVACINTRGSVKCGPCPFGYTGDGRYCVRTMDQPAGSVVPIASQPCGSQNPCHPLATCVQSQYSISCICPPHYSGSGYGTFGCIATNNTIGACIGNPCWNGGTCTNVGLFGFRCDCPAGTLPPRCARAVNPCSPNPCTNGGTCINMFRSHYRCACPSNRSGRNCQQEVRSCGGVLNSFNGTLKFPLSHTYPDNSRCAWLIKTDEDKVLNVKFTKFHLEHSRECRFDWLQIHDGRSSASHMIGRFCGNELPKNGNIVSTQNMLYLWFRSDNSTAHDGFELTWNSTEPVCGGDITIASHGIIASPGSPGEYPPNRDCIWKLTAPTDKRIQLHFFTLQLEAHEDCRYDYLAIHNGPSTDGDLLEKFCNTTHPEPLTSPGNELTLYFHSDESGTDAGFQIHYSLIEGIQGCGGTFTSLNGEFGSPIQNGQYPKNLECHYLIKMPRRNETGIKLTFLSFNLESSTNCNFDYVEIYDGKNENAPKVGRWCGYRTPPSYSSKSGEVLVVFRSDFSFGGDGFRLKYETLCGGRYEEENGIITSPWWPNSYEDNKNCVYDIEGPLGKAIVLNFTDFDIENDCDFDSLTIYDGIDANSTKIGTFCGTRKPPTVISTLNHMHLVFSTDASNTGPGFRATYSFVDAGCGGVIKKLNMTISPPSTDASYHPSSNCKWIIVAPVGYIVQLSFVSFELETSYSCQYDYLAIYDNIVTDETSNSRSIGKYCGSQKPPTIQTTSRAITIIFKSDDSVNGQGFLATYDFINGRNLCGGNFYGTYGTITSPNYPDRYLPSRNCVYVINAPNGKQIQLHIEAFSLEESNGCGFDSLEIRNGQSDKSPLMGTFCGTDILPRFKSFSNHIFLRFKTDSSNELGGFNITYDTSSSGCGGLFTNTQSGTLTSPNYPEPYPANMQCDYQVQVARGSTIILLLTDISLELSAECSYDYVSIYDGPNAASKLIGTYCNSEQLIQLESSSHVVFIRLVTDVNNQGRGFELKFNANCHRQIRDLQGAIESPNFPANYPHYADCEWKIVPPLGNRVYLEFSHFDLERSWSIDDDSRSSSCHFDHLTIEEYNDSGEKVLTDKHCQSMPKPLNTNNTVVLKFISDFSNTAGGFHLEYEIQGCGGHLNRPEGIFSSPNYPQPYPHDVHCQFIIEVEYGHLVEITFTDFDFEATPDCTQDGLIVSNDANATKIIQRFCGSMHNQKGITTSASNKVYVHFFSDMSYAGRGFSATYKSIAAKCGGTFSLAEGNITSPNYPMNYASNTYCQWLLRTEASHSVLLKFTDFDLEDDCAADSVQVYDGPEKREDKLLLKSCGSQMIGTDATNQTRRPGFTEPLKSTGNEMLVVMEADHGVEAKGFAAEYTTSCGSKIVTSSSGMLEIGHNLRWITDNCEWTITAQSPEQHVSLTILHIQNEPIIQKMIARELNRTEAECTKKIFVYDGSSTKAPKIAEICSSTHPPAIISEGHALTLALGETVEYDYAFTFDLKASYSVIDSVCGGEFSSSVSGQIGSPGYPKTYKNNIECEWIIRAAPGNEMTANIVMLDIDETEHCNGDYLEVRETSSTGKLIGVHCGNQIPPMLSQANTYWLKFRSDNDGVGRGFLLEYSYAKLVEQTGTNGIITSPLYPNYIYYTIGSYGWRITVKSGFVVRITVDNCILKRDSIIAVYDGYDTASALLTYIENDALPIDPILSTTNVIYVEFGIESMSESKFKLLWSEVEKSVAELEQSPSNTLNCTGNSVLTVSETDRLQLSSPGFPTGYDTNLNCVWSFLPAKPGYHVDIYLNVLDLEVTPTCLADYLRIGTGQELQNFEMDSPMCSMSQVLRGGRYHGAPNLRVKFQSDYSQNRTGFSSMISLDCGGLLDGPHGEITSKMTVSNGTVNTMNETCQWTITVKTGRTIQFNFEKLNLAKNDDGSCNSYIIIRNGIHDDSPFLGVGKYCNDILSIPTTSSNKAIVQFNRNRVSQRFNEFILKYQQVEHECGGTHTLDYGVDSITISTPNYPNIPTPHIECVWRLIAPNGELLKMEFLERFDLTPSIPCIKEYVEIREGTTTTAPVIGKYCRDKPQPIFSASNMVRLQYFTDVPVPRNGFKVKISFARCGKSIVANDGFITSPGFPGKGAYPTAVTCDYHITGRLGATVNITFLDLDLPDASNCSEVDHIEILSMVRKAGGNITYTEVRKICGFSIPDSILTYSSSALVRFVVKSSNSHMYGGFRFKFQSSIDTCGARIEASSGIIQSPGYPLSPDATKYCEWRITVPKGRRVRIQVLDFDIKQSFGAVVANPVFYNSDQTRISLYNDFNMFSSIHVLYLNNETSAVYYSSDNFMGISALIRRSNAGFRGFKFRFTSNEPSPCVGNLNGMQGSINSPENLTKFYCEFVRSEHTSLIPSQPNVGTLAIKVLEEIINTNRTAPCVLVPTGFAVVFPYNDKRTYFVKCNPPKYENIITPFANTKLIVRSSIYRKYHFTYKVHACGGVLSPTTTRISIPTGLAGSYGELDCAWQYTSNVIDRSIQLLVNAPPMNCETEYLTIYRGSSPNRPRAAKICGDAQTANRTIFIQGQYAFIEYHSDSYSTATAAALQIQILTTDGMCGGVIEVPNSLFSSPRNGTKYLPNTECEWLLRAHNGNHIGLTFVNRFMIEQSPACAKDYLKVFDKVDGEFREIAKICGREFPPFLNSTGQEMKVLFHTDATGDGDGFTAKWVENCGGVFQATAIPKYITSPRYPDPYAKNLYCNYSIVAKEGESVSVQFLAFDLEAGGHLCNFDNITIYKYSQWGWSTFEEVGTYCTNRSVASVFRYTNRIDIVFRTDSFIERSGFKFEYSTDRCGGNITEPMQIGSLNEDNTGVYLPLSTCVWFVTAPADKKILIRFEQFELEHLLGCQLDYVEIYQGHRTVDDHRKAKLCGSLTGHAPAVTVDSNEAVIKFATDASVQEAGFRALILFTKNCNEKINLTSENPRYILNKLTDQYEPLLNCEYFISAPKGYVIRAKFNQMHLTPCTTTATNNNSCTCDYLNVRDGAGPFAELFGTFCGHSTPADMLTTGGDMYMQFVTDQISSGTGFKVELEMIESPCGRAVYFLNSSVDSVTIQSPMDGDKYRPNINCLWTLKTDEGKLIDVKFEKFQLQSDPSNKCMKDYLEISDELSKSNLISEGLGKNSIFSGSPQSKNQYFYWGKQWPSAAHRYCGSGLPIDYLSQSRIVYIHFKSDGDEQLSGFKFTAKIFSECARNYTALQGRLYGKSLSDCEQFITVPENHTITLYFASLDFRTTEECTENTAPLTIYDARNNGMLRFYCSESIPRPLFTATNQLRFKFKNQTLSYVMNELYDITYVATDKGIGCGGELYNYGGTFSSPGYPSTYRNDSECIWTVSVPMNLYVALHFQVFDMGPRSTCEQNYVEILEQSENIAPTRFCGKDNPAPYKGKSNQLKVRFKSGMNFAGTGWVANFMAVHENSIVNNF